jgi:hypothetical protein
MVDNPMALTIKNAASYTRLLRCINGKCDSLRVAHMNNADPADRPTDPRCRLFEIWLDPQVRGYTRRCAGDRDLADDALQNTYYLISRLKHLAEIENQKAYFYQVLRREIARERGQLGAILVEDFVRAAEDRQPVTCAPDEPSAGFEDHACVSAQFWYLRKQTLGGPRQATRFGARALG